MAGIRQNGAVQEPVIQQKTTVPVGSAIRVEDHLAAQGLSITQTSYLMVHGKNGQAYGVVLFFGYASDQASAMTATIQQVVDSFRYLWRLREVVAGHHLPALAGGSGRRSGSIQAALAARLSIFSRVQWRKGRAGGGRSGDQGYRGGLTRAGHALAGLY